MARRFDLLSLQLFVSVCEARSIARAAEIESIAALAISKRIAQMEELAGAALVVRNRSGVAPTKAGLMLLEHARNVLLSLDLIEHDLAGDHRVSRGFLRVYASASAIGEFLASDIVSFLAIPKFSAKLDAAGLPYAPIVRPEQRLDDPHRIAGGGLVPMETDDGGTTDVVLLTLLMGGRRPAVRHRSPAWATIPMRSLPGWRSHARTHGPGTAFPVPHRPDQRKTRNG